MPPIMLQWLGSNGVRCRFTGSIRFALLLTENPSSKLENYFDKSRLSLHDYDFIGDVESDVVSFAEGRKEKRVLVFPPVNNYRRFLIHKLVDEQFPALTTFSIGEGDDRRTVICFKSDYIQPPKPSEEKPTERLWRSSGAHSTGPSQAKRERRANAMPSISIYRPPAARRLDEKNSALHEREQITDLNGKSDCKCPSEVEKTGPGAVSPPRTENQTAKCKSGSAKAESPTTRARPRRPDMKVYVPKARRLANELGGSNQPQPRTQAKAPTVEVISAADEPSEPEKVSDVSEKTGEISDAGCIECPREQPQVNDQPREDADERTSGDQVVEDPKPAESPTSPCVESQNQEEEKVVSLAADEEEVKNEETPPAEESSQPAPSTEVDRPESDSAKASPEKTCDQKDEKPVEKVHLNPDECDWESMFDDTGECLDPSLLDQLSSAVGAVTIEKPKSNYDPFKTKTLDMVSNEFPHVIEIYNFPPEFRLQDLMTVFSPFKNAGFEIKWVDDTHALGIFGNSQIVSEVLAFHHPFVRTRLLKDGTMLSKAKARRSAEQLLPYKPRPDTCPALARRLVRSALGVRLPSTREEREAERKILSQAREKKRLEAKQREEAWEGTFSASN